jgi:hypothetical protein
MTTDKKDILFIRLNRAEHDLVEWKQAAQVEAGLRREYYDRAIRAESALAEIKAICLVPSKDHPKGNRPYDHFASDFDVIRKICDEIRNKA